MFLARLVSAVLVAALLCPAHVLAQPAGGQPAIPAGGQQPVTGGQPAAGAAPAAGPDATDAPPVDAAPPATGPQPAAPAVIPPAREAAAQAEAQALPPEAPIGAPAAERIDAPAGEPGPVDTGEGDSLGGRIVTASILGGIHASFYIWAYFAWYRDRERYPNIEFLNEGWFGANTYAGGADKLGHMYANYAFVRGAVRLLESGGWERRPALAISALLTLGFFTAIEIKDGYHVGFGFSYQDIAANLTGNTLATVLLAFPELDRAIDLRIEYFPTAQFVRELREDGVVDAAEDYTGQAFMLAYHLGSIDSLHSQRYLGWTRYVDVVLGYRAKGYKPEPVDPVANPREQEVYVGLTLDMHALLGLWRKNISNPVGGPLVGGTRGFMEYFQLPYTTLAVPAFHRNNGPLPVDTAGAGQR